METLKNSSNSKTLVVIDDEDCKTCPSLGHKKLDVIDLDEEYRVTKNTGSKPVLKEKREVKNPTTDCETLLHVFKGNIGSGYLALPAAVMNSGLWVGLFAIPILGSLCTYCMHILLKCSQELCRRTGKASLNYEETAHECLQIGPRALRKYAKIWFNVVTCFVILTQLGFCCVYFVFISQNMYQAVECITGGSGLSQFDYMIITLIPMLFICYIPDLKYLAPVSLVANLLQLIGMIITFYYLVRNLPQIGPGVEGFGRVMDFPLFFGTALYSFEGISLVLPLENNMKRPTSLPGKSGVLNTGMVITICLYTAVGFFGYLAYGNEILGSVTLNLPGSEILAQSVKILMSISIFLTYPLQFYVPLAIILPYLVRRVNSNKAKIVVEYTFRTFLVLFTFMLAASIPNVALITNLVGAICSGALSLIFPPFIDIITYWPQNGKYNLKLIKNVLIMFIGIVGFITGTFMSIKEITQFFQLGDTTIPLGC